MKRNILHLAGALLSSAILMFSCSEDIPTYNELTVDKTEVFIQADGENPTAIVNITEGNDNYKISVADENIATATIDGTRVIINGLKNGTTTATVIDWSKHSTVITIKVKEDFELKLDKTELKMVMTETTTETISVLSGNGNYKVTSSDNEVATAELNVESNNILITAIANGTATITVTDGDGLTASTAVTVCEQPLKLGQVPAEPCIVDRTIEVEILSGNGDYTVVSDRVDVATAIIENNLIKVTGVGAGEATMTVTDKMGLSDSFTVTVREGSELKLETTNIDKLMIGEAAQEINILDGSGDYTLEGYDSSIMECIISDSKTKLTIKGLKSAVNQKITLKDNTLDASVDITVKFIDYPFDTYFARGYIGDSFFFPPSSEFTTKGNSPCLKIGEWYKPIFASGYYRNGYALHFEGGFEIGKKENGTLSKLNNSGGEENTVIVTDVEIIKTGEITGEGKGKFWIKFHEQGKEEYSYIVTWT